MWQALLIAAVLGVALPCSAWWFTRRMAAGKPPYSRRRMDAFGVPMDAIDVWLADHTELPALRRLAVRTAIASGRAATEDSLRPVAHQLAAELLAGQVRSDIDGWSGWALAAAGGSEVIFSVTAYLIVRHADTWIVVPASYGVLALTAGLVRPKLLRHRLERARALNAGRAR